ncbi:hypothetical protein Y032_0164g3540 [Ancylostoma ceylanicum]|uniref:Uncharacterized protein n=1 Tax=Ancylostoma ceylanicum TaxID=53326 RepID=A0A016SWK0_9BILA|nr:hypothetical protein Y032_0164g3540 [Ancylostoma ceylanicum]
MTSSAKEASILRYRENGQRDGRSDSGLTNCMPILSMRAPTQTRRTKERNGVRRSVKQTTPINGANAEKEYDN